MKCNKIFTPAKLSLAMCSTLALSSAVQAQQNSAEAATDIERIVVTSRGRVETLQQVPDSVTVINAKEIEQARISSIKDFSALTPNLDVSSNFRSGLNFITVRGLITPQMGEAPLAFVVDGVTVPNLEFINQGLHNIERIEVLRGPQGALYGKNAIGGAVNIVTKEPGNDTEGALQASVAQGDDVKLNAAVSGALVEDKLYGRFSANYHDAEGLIDNSYLHEKVDFVDGAYGAQGMLSYIVNDDTKLTIQGTYSNVVQGSNYVASISVRDLENFSIQNEANAVGEDRSKMWFASAKLEHEIDAGQLTLVTAATDADIEFFSDGDFTHLDASEANFYFPFSQINPISEQGQSAELRFTSANDQSFRWTLGGFVENKDRNVSFDQVLDITPTERVSYDQVKALAAQDPSLVTVGEKTVQDSNAFALFSQANYDLSDDLELTAALRYDSENRAAYDRRAPVASQAEETFAQLQPKASLSWQYKPDVQLYSTYSKGFRSGGFNEYSPAVNRQYDKEISDTLELGSKTSWLDNKLWFNLAAFHIVQDNAQFTRLNPSTFTLENLNIDEVTINGVEVESSLTLIDSIKVSLGAGFIDNEITKNQGIDILSGRDLQDTVGGTMPYVSDFNLNGSITHSLELPQALLLTSRLAFNTLGPRAFDIFNADTGTSSSHTFVNLNLTLEQAKWSVSMFADNLTNERAAETVFLFNPLIRMPNKPRQVGIQTKYSF